MIMANPHKGEFNLEVGNVVYTLLFDWDAICAIEHETGKPIGRLATDLTKIETWSASDARTCVYHGLRHNHPAINKQQAGEMIRQIGGLTKLAPLLNVAIGTAFPDVLEETANPQTPSQRESIGSAG
jgi:hypothetical protein